MNHKIPIRSRAERDCRPGPVRNIDPQSPEGLAIVDSLTPRAKLLAALETGSHTVNDLTEVCGKGRGATQSILNSLERAGVVHRVGKAERAGGGKRAWLWARKSQATPVQESFYPQKPKVKAVTTRFDNGENGETIASISLEVSGTSSAVTSFIDEVRAIAERAMGVAA